MDLITPEGLYLDFRRVWKAKFTGDISPKARDNLYDRINGLMTGSLKINDSPLLTMANSMTLKEENTSFQNRSKFWYDLVLFSEFYGGLFYKNKTKNRFFSFDDYKFRLSTGYFELIPFNPIYTELYENTEEVLIFLREFSDFLH